MLADVLTGVFVTGPMAVSGIHLLMCWRMCLWLFWWDFPGLIFERSHDKVNVYECRYMAEAHQINTDEINVNSYLCGADL